MLTWRAVIRANNDIINVWCESNVSITICHVNNCEDNCKTIASALLDGKWLVHCPHCSKKELEIILPQVTWT